MPDKQKRFHRRAQTLRMGITQKKTGELWGRGAYGGIPAVLAWQNELPPAIEGTEFTTDIPYYVNGHPAWAYWLLPQDGGDKSVREKYVDFESYAVIDITVTKSRYRCRS